MTTTSRTPISKRQRIVLFAIAGLLVLALAIAIPAIAGSRGSEPAATTPAAAASTAPSPTPTSTPTPDLAGEIDVPGYDPAPGPLALTPVAEAVGTPIEATFALDGGTARSHDTLGFSFEATELASPVWGSEDSNIEPMLAALDQPILRFGGLAADRRMWWTSSDEPAPEWARATVTPADLARVAETAEAVDANVTITLDLGHNDPERAADMAQHAREAFGERLLAVTIGNEPNGYFLEGEPDRSIRDDSWTTEVYGDALSTYAAAIEAAAPDTPLAGPGTFDAAWWRAFAEAELPNSTALTMHWYPLYACGTANPHATATIDNMTSPEMRSRAQSFVGRGVQAAEGLGLPLWVEETGPTSCSGGNETSRTHAQALWTTDFALTLQETGAARVAFHSTLQACTGGAPMSAICATGSLDEPGELFQGRTSFLSLMQLGWMPDGQMLLPTVSGDGEVFVHGVAGDDGSVAFMVVDQRDPAAAEGAAAVTLAAPTGMPNAPAAWTLTAGSRLAAPALDATESTLGAPAPLAGAFAGAELTAAAPLTITSEPGTTTLLEFSAR